VKLPGMGVLSYFNKAANPGSGIPPTLQTSLKLFRSATFGVHCR
jgi:hypothetical protein